MLPRLKRETSSHHLAADNDRMALVGAVVDRETYGRYLTRIYGFEAPLEARLAVTRGLDEVIDLRAHRQVRLLRSDLSTLGVVDPAKLPRCSIEPLDDPAEALAWMYVIARNTLFHAVVERHLRACAPELARRAGAYLAMHPHAIGTRLREIGLALDRVATAPAIADRVVAAARNAFSIQHRWYD